MLIGLLVVLLACRTWIESMLILKLTINLPCKIDYLLMCDLWAPMTYRLNVLLKYYNGEMWMRWNRAEREKPWLKGAVEEEVEWREGKGRDDTLYWRGSSDELYWRLCLASMVPQRATSNQSPQSHSLTLLLFLSSFLLTLLISPSTLLFSLPPFFVSVPRMRGDHWPVSQSN